MSNRQIAAAVGVGSRTVDRALSTPTAPNDAEDDHETAEDAYRAAQSDWDALVAESKATKPRDVTIPADRQDALTRLLQLAEEERRTSRAFVRLRMAELRWLDPENNPDALAEWSRYHPSEDFFYCVLERQDADPDVLAMLGTLHRASVFDVVEMLGVVSSVTEETTIQERAESAEYAATVLRALAGGSA